MGSVQVGIEDFRVMTEAAGMQLDDDSLLALFSRVRPGPHNLMPCNLDHLSTSLLSTCI